MNERDAPGVHPDPIEGHPSAPVDTRTGAGLPELEFRSLILGQVSDAIISIDNDGRVTYLNASAEHQYEITAADAAGRPLSELYTFHWLTPDDEAAAAESLSSRGSWRGENLHVLPSGRFLHVESSVTALKNSAGDALGLLAVIRDVTAARQLARELRDRDERFRRALSIETVGVLFFTLDGRMTDANAAFERMSGYRLDELRALAHWRQLTSPDFLGLTARAAEQLLAQGETPPYEKQMIRKDGSRWWGLFAPRRIAGSGVSAECVEFVVDISESKRAEAALREADRQKDEFLAILAHELRNPLAPIRTAVGILRAHGALERLPARARDVIERQVAHMTRLIDDLLDVSRLSRGQITLQNQVLQLDQILDAAIETALPAIEERRHHLAQRRSDTSICIEGDGARLSQVFANLLNNAAKYTPPEGTISIGVEEGPGTVDVHVTDSGQGIVAERLDTIFDLFAQGSGAQATTVGGLGIGLAVARRLVELHGGTLTAASPGPQRGATFTVTLPRRDTTVASCDRAKAQPEPARRLSRRVLVVDDSRDATDTTAALLESAGCVVRAAYSGEDALSHIDAFHPEIVLLDIGMPGLNGLEVCRRMRSTPHGEALFIVAVTGWGQEEDRRRTRDAGFDVHLVKPVAPDALLDVVERARPPRG